MGKNEHGKKRARSAEATDRLTSTRGVPDVRRSVNAET
jgi:hypothetical protein